MSTRTLITRPKTPAALSGKVCAIIGFGSQGRAQASNLRDSGVDVIIGIYRGSRSWAVARKCGFKVMRTEEAVRCADVLFLALPDTKMPDVFESDIKPNLRRGQTLLLAHGFAILYRTVVPPRYVDVVMVAPKGLGPMVRREFVAGRGVPALVAVHQDFTGRARQLAFAWARAIGSGRARIIETTFREETETDLFGEQAVLCGGTANLIRAGFETLVEAGYAPELAYFECLHELKFIVDLIHEQGLAGMRRLISDTARWGELTVGPKIIDRHTRSQMKRALRDIRSGKFAKQFIREVNSGGKKFRALVRAGEKHAIESTGKRLRTGMRWKKPGERAKD
jgi:ketol-acid reductoisomerase